MKCITLLKLEGYDSMAICQYKLSFLHLLVKIFPDYKPVFLHIIKSDNQDLKQIGPVHNSHAVAVNQVCPNNLNGGVLT